MTEQLHGLLRRADDPHWEIRAAAAEQLCAHIGAANADAALRRLLLDVEDTAVTVAAADALLATKDASALRHFLWAVGTVTVPDYQDPADDLLSAYHDWVFELAVAGPDAERAFAMALDAASKDNDPAVVQAVRALRQAHSPI